MIPLSENGPDTLENLDVLCDRCHKEWHENFEGAFAYNDFLELMPTHVWTFVYPRINEEVSVRDVVDEWKKFRSLIRDDSVFSLLKTQPQSDDAKLLSVFIAGIPFFESISKKAKFLNTRMAQGIARAKQAGKYKGRAPTAQAKSAEVLRLKDEGSRVCDIVAITGVSRASIYRILDSRAGAPARV